MTFNVNVCLMSLLFFLNIQSPFCPSDLKYEYMLDVTRPFDCVYPRPFLYTSGITIHIMHSYTKCRFYD